MERVVKALQEEFTIANGYEHDIVMMYGDNNSICMNFGVDAVDRSLELTKIASYIINKILKIPETKEITYKLQSDATGKKRYVAIPYRNVRNC